LQFWECESLYIQLGTPAVGVFSRGRSYRAGLRSVAAAYNAATTTTMRIIRLRPPIAHRIHRPRDLTSLPVAPLAAACRRL